MKPAGIWPTVNQLVEVHIPTSTDSSGTLRAPGWLPSRVEDREDRRLVLAAPFDITGELLVARPGDPVALRWVEQRGLGRLDTTVTGGNRGRLPLWELWANEIPTLHQRRHFARVPIVVPVSVVGGGGEQLLVSLDVAEGGVLCLADPTVALQPEQRVRLTLEVGGRRLEAEASVVRSKPAPGGATIAFRFIALPRSDADHLRRFVYTRQVYMATVGRP
jgi:c-di-GMP-binding flagellar brake protein YcgR